MDNLRLFNNLLKSYYYDLEQNNPYISQRDMNIIDNNCEYLGINKILLMENAGKSVANEVINYLVDQGNRIYAFCGLGNNGGDGFVAIRHLMEYCNYRDSLKVILLGREEYIKTHESKENFKILKNISQLDLRLEIKELPCSEGVLKIIKEIEDNTTDNIIVIDAMLGTGIKGELREPFKTLVRELNRLKAFKKNLKIISVDVETRGLIGDVIISFHRNKLENDINKTLIKSIGIPSIANNVVGLGDMVALKNIDPNSHKGNNGKVLVIGGSKEYFGAPILSALSSSKIVDLTTVVSVRPTIEALRNYPHLIGYEVEGDYIRENHLDEIIELSKNYHVVILGNGLGVREDTKEFVNKFINEVGNKKMVIDADAIKVIDYNNFKFTENYIFTPHKREFEYMGIDLENVDSIKEIKSTIVLKGRYDIIFNNQSIKINNTGNRGMTVGGTGDVLCGIIGGLFCNNEAFLSACCGVFVNGYSGDMLLQEKGYYYTAMDVLENIPRVLSIFK